MFGNFFKADKLNKSYEEREDFIKSKKESRIILEGKDTKSSYLRSKSIHQKDEDTYSPKFKLYTRTIGDNSLEEN